MSDSPFVDESGVYRRCMDEAPRPVPAPEPHMPEPTPAGPSPEELAVAEAELQDLLAKLDRLKHPQETK